MLGEVVVVLVPRPRGCWVDDAAAADAMAMVIGSYWYWSNINIVTINS